MECDPDLCGKCFLTSQHLKKNLCQNNSLYFNIQKVRKLVFSDFKMLKSELLWENLKYVTHMDYSMFIR